MNADFWSINTEEVRRLWQEGLSAAQIAAHFDYRISRSAVCGKLSRLGLFREGAPPRDRIVRTAAASDGSRRYEKRKPRASTPPAPIEEPPPVLLETGEPMTLLTAPKNACRWMPGMPHEGDFRICGHAQVFESSYCNFHRARSIGQGTASERAADKAPKARNQPALEAA